MALTAKYNGLYANRKVLFALMKTRKGKADFIHLRENRHNAILAASVNPRTKKFLLSGCERMAQLAYVICVRPVWDWE